MGCIISTEQEWYRDNKEDWIVEKQETQNNETQITEKQSMLGTMIKKIIGKTFVTIICLAPIARIYSKKSVKGITIETEKIRKNRPLYIHVPIWIFTTIR